MSIKTRGYGFPINTEGSFPFFTKQSDDRLVKNNVLQNILTIPGERVYRPNYGTNISSMVFKSNTSDILIDLKTEVIKQVPENDPRVVVKSVNIMPGQNKNTLLIDVSLQPVQSPEETIEVRRLVGRLVKTG